MSTLVDFADIGPIPEPKIWTKPPLDLDDLEAKITGLTPQWPLPGPAEKAMRDMIAEVRELRAAPAAQSRQWGPWIDWAGGDCPIPDAKAQTYELRFRNGEETSSTREGKSWIWANGEPCGADIIAYRVRLPADDLLRQAIEALRAIVARSQTDELGTSKVIDMRNLAATVLTAYDKRSA